MHELAAILASGNNTSGLHRSKDFSTYQQQEGNTSGVLKMIAQDSSTVQ